MSVPSFAYKKMVNKGIPTANKGIECQSKDQFGDLTFVIGGKDYTLTNDEWMFDPQSVSMA